MSAPDTRVATTGLGRRFGDVVALEGIDLSLEPGRLVVVHGRSGSGKTTLLNLVGGLDQATEGTLVVAGRQLGSLSDAARADFRREVVSFVFQNFGLVDVLTAAENVAVPLRAAGDVRRLDERVDEELDRVGLLDRRAHLPAELSGGEQQRVAVARALVVRRPLLVADEPTGQLDSGTADRVISAIRAAVDVDAVTAIVASHDPRLIAAADVSIELSGGRRVPVSGSRAHDL